MLRSIRNFFEQNILSPAADAASADDHALQLAAASLLIEIARADFEIHDAERQAITASIQGFFGLSDEETQDLVKLAEAEAEQATCLFEFTALVNEHFSYAQKLKVIDMMWQVSFADAHKDKYEEHLIRKVAELVYVSHADFIRLREQRQVEQ